MGYNIEELVGEKKEQIVQIMGHPLFVPFPRSIEDSYHFGWARGICLFADTIYHSNWFNWLSILGKGEWKLGDPTPKIDMSPSGNDEVRKMMKKSYEPLSHRGLRAYEFLEWIGYAIGLSWFKKPSIDEKSWKHLYETFDFSKFYEFPSDYFSMFLAENGQSGVADYFPTPLHVTIFMNKILECNDREDEGSFIDTVWEPCVGTGAMTLPSTSLNIVAADLNHIMVRAAAIQAFFYKPSMLYVPRPVVGIHADPKTLTINRYYEFNTDTRIFNGNSLLGEFSCPKSIFLEDSEFVEVYFGAIDLEKHEIYQFEDELEKPWETLDKELQIKIVQAMSREIQPQKVMTNPPFNMKLPSFEKARIEEIHKRNEVFLEMRESKKRLALFQSIEKEVEEKIKIAASDDRKTGKEQLMFVF
ncbi:hypothetical protein [Bacillus sp. FJAT-29937]|uniref:hypothetical protein n=1 Tax=Bacillus sp. FJAT-29937 TaxID=1720553 RepID=UPI000829A1E3|nr:hypothetical protein [Bacillus sp. FJAT-29937]